MSGKTTKAKERWMKLLENATKSSSKHTELSCIECVWKPSELIKYGLQNTNNTKMLFQKNWARMKAEWNLLVKSLVTTYCIKL